MIAVLASGGFFARIGAGESETGYTPDQAQRGQRLYGAYCASCHGVELEGGVGPALPGARFLHGWAEKGAGDLYYVLRTTMPKPAVGSLSAQASADLLSFVLQRNGMPAGEREFDGSAYMLAAIDLRPLAADSGPAPAQAPAIIAGKRGTPIGRGPGQEVLSADSDPADWLYHTGD